MRYNRYDTIQSIRYNRYDAILYIRYDTVYTIQFIRCDTIDTIRYSLYDTTDTMRYYRYDTIQFINTIKFIRCDTINMIRYSLYDAIPYDMMSNDAIQYETMQFNTDWRFVKGHHTKCFAICRNITNTSWKNCCWYIPSAVKDRHALS